MHVSVPATHRIWLFAGVALVALNLRLAVTSVAPLLGVVRADVGLTPAHASVLGALSPLAFSACGLLTTVLARRIGLERSLILSLGLAFGGTIGRSFASDPVGFLVWTTVAMAGLGMGNILMAPLIKRYFPQRIALVTTTYTLFLVIGQALPPVFILSMANTLGWRTAMGLWAVVAVAAAVPWLATRRWWPRKTAKPVAANATAKTPRPHARTLWRSPITWGIAGMLGANSMAGYCMMAWLPQLLIDSGMTPDAGAWYLAVFTVGCLFGAVVVPPLMTRVRHVTPFVIAMPLSWAVGIVGLLLSPTVGTFWWIAITRFGDGLFAAAMTLMNLRCRRPETVIMLSGVAQAFSYLLAAIVSFAFGWIHATTGAWTAPLITLAIAITAIGTTGAWLASRPVMVEDALGRQVKG